MPLIILQSDPLRQTQWEQGLELALAAFDAGIACQLAVTGDFLVRIMQLEKGHPVIRKLRQVELYAQSVYCASEVFGARGPGGPRLAARRCFRFIDIREFHAMIDSAAKVLSW